MSNGYGQLQVFATNAGIPLAAEICKNLSCKPGRARVGRFKDGELDVQIEENVRDNDVFIVAPTPVPTDNFLEAVLLAEAARGSSARRVTFVIPYLGYARADRKDQPRKPIAAKTMIRMLELARPDRFIFLDVHAEQTLACVEHARFDHLFGSTIAVPRIKELLPPGTPYIVAAPDHGAAQRAHKYASFISGNDDPNIVIFSKRRPRAGEVSEKSIKIIGDVRKKLVIIVDDLIDSATTLVLAASKAKQKGAIGVWAFATHPVLSPGALARIKKSPLDHVFVTDSIWHDWKQVAMESGDKVERLSAASLLAQAIHRTHEGESLSSLIL